VLLSEGRENPENENLLPGGIRRNFREKLLRFSVDDVRVREKQQRQISRQIFVLHEIFGFVCVQSGKEFQRFHIRENLRVRFE
jgi:hypothetical protein